MGVGTKLGLTCKGTLVEVFKEALDGADQTVGTVNLTYKTIIPTHAIDGSHDYDFWFKYRI